jgi:hypothetical protein
MGCSTFAEATVMPNRAGRGHPEAPLEAACLFA